LVTGDATLDRDATLDLIDLRFTWPGASTPAINGVTLHLPPGRQLGVVGASGSGKSTLAALLTRQEDPPPATIRLGGHDLRELTLDAARGAVSLVPQEPFLFALSIHDNIALGRDDVARSDTERVAKLAGIHDEIAALPRGYDTVVGERGVTLSGGQRQRVAIARALLRPAPILVLDDCLSAVDPLTEQTILANLRTAIADRTVIIIAHRLSAVQAADEIIVLESGRIAERGGHDALIAAGGRYARLAELQRLAAEDGAA
jgi:ATP-binding cassette subfamily B multidrug efflux pump